MSLLDDLLGRDDDDAEEEEREDLSREELEAERMETIRRAQREKAGAETEGGEYIAEHTVTEGETLSHIALKYYGSAVKDRWMQIYEANRDVIGDDPNLIRPGQELKIPKLEEGEGA